MVPLQLLVASALAWAGEPNGKVIEFTMERSCRPCQTMSPIVSRLQRQGFPIEKIDIDHDKKTPAEYGVDRFPTFILVVDGREVERRSGVMSEESLKAMCAQIPLKPTDRAPQPRAAANSAAGGVDLGQPSELPNSSSVQKEPEKKPGAIARFFGGKKKDTAPAAPREARAQGEDAAVAATDRLTATPLAATVRLRVTDNGGDYSLGTGTIIDSRPGQTLILTCGHIFRRWAKGSQVHVDLCHGEKTTTIVGKKLAVELDEDAGIDVALVSISTDQPLPACRIARSGAGILAGASVASVGCGGGERPTVQQQKITRLNRYAMNDIECSAMPAEGRSGGGLFDKSGQVIGVCMCADPKYREGLYAGLKTIHAFLDRQGLARLYRGESPANEETQLAAVAENDVDDSSPDLGEPADSRAESGKRKAESGTTRQAIEQPARAVAEIESNRGRDLQPAVSQEDVVGSEVVIIIRTNGQPGAPSKVVRLHRASRGFWQTLLPELDPREALQETALKSESREPPQRPARRQARRPTTNDPQTNAGGLVNFDASADEPRPYRRQRSARYEELVGATH